MLIQFFVSVLFSHGNEAGKWAAKEKILKDVLKRRSRLRKKAITILGIR